MCGKSIDDIRKSLQPVPKQDEVFYPGVEEEKSGIKKDKNKNIDEIHAFVDKL